MGSTPFVSTAPQIPNLLKVEVRSSRACGAGSRLQDPGWAIALVYGRRSNPPFHTQDPWGSTLLGLFVCMQDGKGLQHCLHKIQSLTISKTALAQHQQNSVQSSHVREHTPPTFPASQARNFSATEGCHRLVTIATQPTLNQTKKKKKLHFLHHIFFFFPPLDSFLNGFPIT